MIRRVLGVAFGIAVILLMCGAPASAKGPDSATISGPGIGTKTLDLVGPDYRSFTTLLDVARPWDDSSTAWVVDPPAGELGPRFELTYRASDLQRPHHGKGELVRQDLYPFADAGPVVFMPDGQTMFGMDMASGWFSADHRLTQVVKRLGGTRPPAESGLQPTAHEASASDSRLAWGLIAAGAAGAVLLAALTAVRWRRLRVPRRA